MSQMTEVTRWLLRLGEDEPVPHVCGNCRNPWTKAGREDCPNNTRETR